MKTKTAAPKPDARTRATSAIMRRAAKDAVAAAHAGGTKIHGRRAGNTVALAPEAI